MMDFWAALFAGKLPPLASLRPVAPPPPVSVGSSAYGALRPAARVGNALALPLQPGNDGQGGIPDTREITTDQLAAITGLSGTGQARAGSYIASALGRALDSTPLGVLGYLGGGVADVIDTNAALKANNFKELDGLETVARFFLPDFVYDGKNALDSRFAARRDDLYPGQPPLEDQPAALGAASPAPPVSTNALADAYNASAFGPGHPGGGGLVDDPFDGAFDRGWGDPGYY